MSTFEPLVDLGSPSRLPGRSARETRKRLVRRFAPDRSQAIRRLVQGLFIALNLLLGIQFYYFVRQFEPGGGPARVGRPAGVEGWLPIAGLMNLKYTLLTGEFGKIHPASMFLLIAFLLICVLFRKSFCGWLCPIGTLSEALWKSGRKIMRRNWSMHRRVDLPLRSLKYLLLGFFLFAVAGMSADAIRAFFAGPYGLVADVKMLNFFRELSRTAIVTLTALAVLSIVYQNFWCRYLCPYGALMGLASLVSPAKIRRREGRCIDCAKCAGACPALLPVDKLMAVRSAECMACLECVAVCPAEGALEMSFPRRRRIPAWAMAGGMALLFLGVVGYAKWRGVWDSPIPVEVYRQLVPISSSLSHPR